MKNNIILNTSISLYLSPAHNNHHIKLVTSIYPIPTSTIPTPILHSTPSINNTLILLSQPDLKKQTYNIIPYITTTYGRKKSKQRNTKKFKKQVDTLQSNLFITTISPTIYSTNPTMNDHTCTTSTSQSSKPLIPFPDDSTQNSLSLQYSNTDVIHDHKKFINTHSTQNSTAHVDNKFITSNRRHRPIRIKPYTRDV